MAMIQCPECGKEISDEAKVCPGCGKPMKKGKPINKKKIAIISTIVAVVIVGVVVVWLLAFRKSPLQRRADKCVDLVKDMEGDVQIIGVACFKRSKDACYWQDPSQINKDTWYLTLVIYNKDGIKYAGFNYDNTYMGDGNAMQYTADNTDNKDETNNVMQNIIDNTCVSWLIAEYDAYKQGLNSVPWTEYDYEDVVTEEQSKEYDHCMITVKSK